MGIPGLGGVNASQIRLLIEQLQKLLSQQDLKSSDVRRNPGCYGNDQQEFQRIVDQIRSLSGQLEDLGVSANADNGKGRLNIRITT